MRTVMRFFLVLACVVGLVAPVSAAHAAAAAPTISVESDRWHVNATLSGVSTFEFFVKATGVADQYFRDVRSRFLVDPLVYGGRSVTVSARARTSPTDAWSSSVTFTVASPVPSLATAADQRHVTATLPQAVTFVFVVKTAGLADAYFGNVASTFAVDPWTYGGRTVLVSARAQGTADHPWAPSVQLTVPVPTAGVPILEVKPDRRHVYATLPGTSNFEFVVKSTGLADAYFNNTGSAFAIDPAVYGGRTVRVSARIGGPIGPAWSTAVTVAVPPLKYYGIANAQGPAGNSGAIAKGVGVTLNRDDWKYPASFATLDALVERDAAAGLTPLPILSHYQRISTIDAEAWSEWAAGVVARYGPGGDFWAGRADGHLAPVYFEVLNEPFVPWFYAPPEPAAYATFFKTVVTRARAANPQAKFLFGTDPQPFHDGNGNWTTQTWNELVKAAPDGPAALALADAVTVHPYNSYVEELGWGRAADTHRDFPDKPVWFTEIGFRLDYPLDGGVLTEESQAAYLQRSLADFVNWPWAQAYIWFKMTDYSATTTTDKWGLVNWDGTPRLAYHAYRGFIS
jgi:hypothetical protein